MVWPAQSSRVHVRRRCNRQTACSMRPSPRGTSMSTCVITHAARTMSCGSTAPAATAGSRFGATHARTTFSPAHALTRTFLVTQPFRLPAGGIVDRAQPLAFEYDGVAYQGYAGDTLASALLANGVHRVAQLQVSPSARHFLGRRRRAERAGATRAKARRTYRAERTSDYAGVVRRADCVKPELLAIRALRYRRNQQCGVAPDPCRLLLQDVYVAADAQMVAQVRTRDSPRRRHGAAASEPDPDHYEHRYAHCDVLVIGGGATGSQQRAAAHAGARDRVR